MANFVFEELLSPIDFEHLVRDLLSKELDLDFSAFAEGGDGGTDLRFSANGSNDIIIQCKRAKQISTKMLEDEAEKISKLTPRKYYFVTSNELSVKKVDQVKSIFGEWMDGDNNIYYKSKLNMLLEKHSDVLQKHHKLWLYSSTIFNNLINKPLYERSRSLVADIKKTYKFFVKNESLNKSLEILNKNQFIIISGIPGIGKTTLAKMLLIEYLLHDFEVVEIRNVAEGERLLEDDSKNKQVFYFDDFLGENFLKHDVIEGRSNDLVQFTQRVMGNKHKVLIMTTREYILQQAKERYDKLDSKEFNVFKYTLDLSSYSKRIKTMILYNHLFYSGIGESYISNLILKKHYKTIIGHENYSPRIIEHMTMNIEGIESDNYAKTFIENLDKPFKIWDKAFNGQISEGAKFTSYLLLSMGENILLSDLSVALNTLHTTSLNKINLSINPLDFKNYIKELEGSFIKISLSNNSNRFVSFQNPSVKDFLLELISNNKQIVHLIISGVTFFKQLIYSVDYLAKNFLNDKETLSLIDTVIADQFDSLQNFTYIYYENKENNAELKTIDKLFELRNYMDFAKDESTKQFLFTKFKNIDYYARFSSNKKYISFYKKFYDKLDLNFVELMTAMIKNIYWIDDAKDINLLQEIDEVLFIETKKLNASLFLENINSAIELDIQYTNSIHGIKRLKKDIEEYREIWGIEDQEAIETIDTKLSVKLGAIQEKESLEDKSDEIIIEDEEKTNDDDFDEDVFFKLEMF